VLLALAALYGALSLRAYCIHCLHGIRNRIDLFGLSGAALLNLCSMKCSLGDKKLRTLVSCNHVKSNLLDLGHQPMWLTFYLNYNSVLIGSCTNRCLLLLGLLIFTLAWCRFVTMFPFMQPSCWWHDGAFIGRKMLSF